MDDFETITGKVNNAEKPYPPPSREGSVLGNWKENGNDNSPSPKHPGKAKNLFPIIFQSIGSSFEMRLQMLYSILTSKLGNSFYNNLTHKSKFKEFFFETSTHLHLCAKVIQFDFKNFTQPFANYHNGHSKMLLEIF